MLCECGVSPLVGQAKRCDACKKKNRREEAVAYRKTVKKLQEELNRLKMELVKTQPRRLKEDVQDMVKAGFCPTCFRQW